MFKTHVKIRLQILSKSFLMLCFCCYVTKSSAQEQRRLQKDSLLHVLKNKELTKSKQVSIFLKLINYYKGGDSAFYYTNKIIEIGRDIKNNEFIYEGYYRRVEAHMAKHNFDSARVWVNNILSSKEVPKKIALKTKSTLGFIFRRLKKTEEAESLFLEVLGTSEINSPLYASLKASTLERLGILYGDQNKREKERAFYFKAIKALEESDTLDYESLSQKYLNIGYSFFKDGDSKSLEYYDKGISLAEQYGSPYLLANLYNNYTTVIKVLKPGNELILKLLLKAESLGKEVNSVQVLATTYINLASEQKEDEKALFYYEKALKEIKNMLSPSFYIFYVYDGLARIHNKMNNIDKAIFYNEKSIAANKGKLYDSKSLCTSYSRLGSIYMRKKKEYAKAKTYFVKANELAKETKDVYELRRSYAGLFRVNQELNNHEEALYDYYRYRRIKDSLINAKTQEKMDALLVKYETVEKEKKILQLSSENEIQSLELKSNQYLLAALSIFFALGILIVFLLLRSKKEHIKKRLTEIELYFLQRQMNPHFISNALTAIQNKVLDKKIEITHNYLSRFSLLIRNVLVNSRENRVCLKDEIKTLESYLFLETSINENLFEYDITIDESIDASSTYLPTMILQPLIENTIAHGFTADSKGNYVHLKVKKEADYIVYIVEDNGIGINSSLDKKRTKSGYEKGSLSTKILKERISLLNKKVKQEIKLRIIDRKEVNIHQRGTIAQIDIPLAFS
jgi:tetratricopeptide (TPR) repeat protein/two-component sensor histidine kinase